MCGEALADFLRVEVDVDVVDVAGYLAEDRPKPLGLDRRRDRVVDLEERRRGELVAQPVAARVQPRAQEHDLGCAVRDFAEENLVHVPRPSELEPERAGQHALDYPRAEAPKQRHLGESAHLQAGRDEVFRHVVRVPDLGVAKGRPGRAKRGRAFRGRASHPASLSIAKRHRSPTLSALACRVGQAR